MPQEGNLISFTMTIYILLKMTHWKLYAFRFLRPSSIHFRLQSCHICDFDYGHSIGKVGFGVLVCYTANPKIIWMTCLLQIACDDDQGPCGLLLFNVKFSANNSYMYPIIKSMFESLNVVVLGESVEWRNQIDLARMCMFMGKPKTSVMNIFLYSRNLVIFQDLGLSNCGRFVIQNAYRLYSISFFLP
jgi:hypothetical protein